MTAAAPEVVADELGRLAREVQRMRLAEREKPPRAHDTPRRKDIYLSGYLAGLCCGLAMLRGESSLDLQASIIAEVGL